MTAKQTIRQLIEFCHFVTDDYYKDLSDADLMRRPVPGANHIAWQLGHLIAADTHFLKMLGHTAPPLPAGFDEQHSKAAAAIDDPAHFCTLAEYVRLVGEMKPAKLAAVDATPEADLEKPGPESMRSYCPTVASVLMLMGTHWLMHAGQFVPVRRLVGKKAMY